MKEGTLKVVFAVIVGVALYALLLATGSIPSVSKIEGKERVRRDRVGAPQTSNNEQFYSGYKRIQCNSCTNASQLENPRSPIGFVIGVQKAGTSRMLKNLLPRHPSIYRGVHRELHMFDQISMDEDDGNNIDRCSILQQYNDLLLGAKKGQGIVDKTPKYVVGSHIIPQRILCVFPNAKFIILLRNPTDRAYSRYQMKLQTNLREGFTGDYPSFEELSNTGISYLDSSGLTAELTPQEEYELWSETEPEVRHNLVVRGLYHIQVRQYMSVLGDHFGWDNLWDHLLILEAEAVWRDEGAHLNKIIEFLGLKPFDFQVEPRGFGGHNYGGMDNATRARLDDVFRPHNRKLHDLLAPFGIEISWAASP